METTIGGQRLGSGNKMKASFRNYERSTHDLSYIWRSTMASGTLVPFMSELSLPGDTFDISLGCSVLTHPTIGPLFGSYKVQLDVFSVPIRLYQAGLHMNMLEIGMKMNEMKLPIIELAGRNKLDLTKNPDNQQINPSCIFKYLNISGLGLVDSAAKTVKRSFCGIPYLAYWDIYKNYYANKQEEIGAVIHTPTVAEEITVDDISTLSTNPLIQIPNTSSYLGSPVVATFYPTSKIEITTDPLPDIVLPENFKIYFNDGVNKEEFLNILFTTIEVNKELQTITYSNPTAQTLGLLAGADIYGIAWVDKALSSEGKPYIKTFPLSNIDTMRMTILQHGIETPFMIADASSDLEPYNLPLEKIEVDPNYEYSLTKGQEGLALKTYQSDLFNNWLSTEWIDGQDGISAITAVSTAGDSFTIDELNMSKKIYDMLNRIALSDGSYDDWLDAVYTHERSRGQENPAYLGGLIKELAFQEVVSNSATETEPLGTLAGRGQMTSKHKGGKIIAKFDEPCYLIGLVSITPRIDYSQGNKWDTNLKTMDDLHKPALDQIGFQDLITDQMAWFDTKLDSNGVPTYKSAGKQPAWINYMTNVNTVKGNFASNDDQMFMVLNRRYEAEADGNLFKIKDLTTYIDPSKFNHIFADTRLDAQNFWCQISLDITARRKMSAKLIPNL